MPSAMSGNCQTHAATVRLSPSPRLQAVTDQHQSGQPQPDRKIESEKRRVINDDNNNGERTEKIETRLTPAILKARVDRSFACGLVNGANVAGG
jgi:hypothetical protein